MGLPLRQAAKIGAYVMKKHLSGQKKYPLVLMLEPLFRCNLACAGCGKIDYPDEILNQRLSYDQCMNAIDECGAPAVSIAGGEPLLHRDMAKIVKGFIERDKFVILCTNALLLAKKIDQYEPHENFTWSIHLDGDKAMHDKSVCLDGTYDKAVAAIKLAKERGFRTQINCTLFEGSDPDRTAKFFDEMMAMGLDGITVSPGYAYERAPDQQHFLNRENTKKMFREIFARGHGGKDWEFTQSSLFLDFLAGNRTYECTPWSMPLLTVFGWQKPCYLLGEGYAKTFEELMEGTEWQKYGVGNYEKCANCMVHCGFEGSAVLDSTRNPFQILPILMRGVKTDGPMAKDIDLSKQRPAEFTFARHVEHKLSEIKTGRSNTTETGPAEIAAAE
jgi:hopanoid biosynthesis associated radical SAM protein HpnH